jgi:UDP-N-acetylmuramoyl-tripeptide--D-alanyl-D-alanine ligase
MDWPHGSVLDVEVGRRRARIPIRLIGRHSAYAALAAVAVGLEAGLAMDEIRERIAGVEPSEGRMEPVALPGGAFLLRDDYKAALESIEEALETLADIPAQRRIVVLGEVAEPPGTPSQVYGPIGARLAEVADQAVLICSRRNFRAYRSGMRTVWPDSDPGRVSNWREAVAALDLGPGDVVLVKGRDTQRLARISLALQGQRVTCDLSICGSRYSDCAHCPSLGTL